MLLDERYGKIFFFFFFFFGGGGGGGGGGGKKNDEYPVGDEKREDFSSPSSISPNHGRKTAPSAERRYGTLCPMPDVGRAGGAAAL